MRLGFFVPMLFFLLRLPWRFLTKVCRFVSEENAVQRVCFVLKDLREEAGGTARCLYAAIHRSMLRVP